MSSLMLPISIGSSFFRSEIYTKHLLDIPKKYDRRFFFVADGLQMYNRALLGDGLSIGEKIIRFYDGKDYLAERKHWLSRLGHRAGLEWVANAEVFGTNSLSDASAWRIHRNVRILYECDPLFNADVKSWSQSYSGISALASPEVVRNRLSVDFVLEEIAFNIRIRVFGEIDAEFYPGAYPIALPALYENKYSASVVQIAGFHPTVPRFDFFSIGPDGESWISAVQ